METYQEFNEMYSDAEVFNDGCPIGEGIKNDKAAEWAIRKIREKREDKDRLIDTCKAMIQDYEDKIAKAEHNCETESSYLLHLLYQYFGTVQHKETKTQESYKLPSGSLVWKKEKQDFEKDEEALLNYAKASAPEFIKVKESIDWAEFKKVLEVVDGQVIDTTTGEAVEGITVTTKEGSFDIK